MLIIMVIFLLDGGTVRLPRIVGLGNALHMIITGLPVTASEAFRLHFHQNQLYFSSFDH